MSVAREDIVDLLAQVPVFETLEADDLRHVADVAVPRRFRGGEVIFREGDESERWYIVRSGPARVMREHAHGRSLALPRFGHGVIFAELAMFDDKWNSSTAEETREL